jgi:hypothetical protein
LEELAQEMEHQDEQEVQPGVDQRKLDEEMPPKVSVLADFVLK